MSRATCVLVEEVAANAVAATCTQLVDGWLLRAWPEAPFRRCNAVLAIRGEARGVDARLAVVEDFYRRRRLPVRFQLGPVVEPQDLESRLATRGYEIEARSFVQTAILDDVLAATANGPASSLRAAVTATPDRAWLDAAKLAHGEAPAERHRIEAYASLFARLGPRGIAATIADDGGRVIAVGFAVVERGWAGLFGMGTRPEMRRQGVATALLHVLATETRALGASRMYLQVEADNLAALALYARCGFDAAYGYHYRSLGLRPG
jgi:GNAT superfamily N-acetyltransferase